MGPNYEAMSGIANGIKEGLLAYQTQKQINRQQDMAGLLQGVETDPATGKVRYTPQKQAEIDFQKQKMAQDQAELIHKQALMNPESPETLRQLELTKSLTGQEIPKGMTGQEAISAQGLLVPKLKAVTSENISQDRIEAAAQRAAEAAARSQSKNEFKASKDENKDFTNMGKALGTGWTARSGNAGKVQAVINSADRLNGLFSQFPDGNVPKGQTTELATAVAGMISGGSPQSQHQIDMMVPSTMKGNAADIASWFTGDPKGREQQAFIHQLQDTTNRELEIAKTQKKQWQLETLADWEHLRNSNPDRFARMVKAKTGFSLEDLEKQPEQKGLINATAAPQTGTQQGPQIGAQKTQNGHTYTWNGKNWE